MSYVGFLGVMTHSEAYGEVILTHLESICTFN